MKQLLYDYHRLVERNSSEVNGAWLGLQILFFAMSAVFSFLCEIFIRLLTDVFDTDCILYPKLMVYQNVSERVTNLTDILMTQQSRVPIDHIRSQWSDSSVCVFSFFNPIMSIIFAIVWITFFVMCPGLPRPWRIVIPGFVFTLAYSIVCSVILSVFQTGMEEFSNMFNNMTKVEHFDDVNLIRDINIYVTGSVISAWLYTVFWICSMLLLVLRCLLVADFKLLHVKVELLMATAKSPSIGSEDFSPNESPTFPLHSLTVEPIRNSPKILKYPDDKPREKKFVNLMEPLEVRESSPNLSRVKTTPVRNVDTVKENINVTPNPIIVKIYDTKETKIAEPFALFTVEPEDESENSDSSLTRLPSPKM